VVITTAHQSFPPDEILRHAKLVIDTRNLMRGRTASHLVRLLIDCSLFSSLSRCFWAFPQPCGILMASPAPAALELGQPAYFFHCQSSDLWVSWIFFLGNGSARPWALREHSPRCSCYFVSFRGRSGRAISILYHDSSRQEDRPGADAQPWLRRPPSGSGAWKPRFNALVFWHSSGQLLFFFRLSGPQKNTSGLGPCTGWPFWGTKCISLWIVPAVFWIRQEPDFQRRNLARYLGTLVAWFLSPICWCSPLYRSGTRFLSHSQLA